MNENKPVPDVVAVAGYIHIPMSTMLPKPLYDLDGKKCTFDDLIADELRASVGIERQFRFPDPLPPTPLTLRQRARVRLAGWFRVTADRLWDECE